jgi:hypothetical protein
MFKPNHTKNSINSFFPTAFLGVAGTSFRIIGSINTIMDHPAYDYKHAVMRSGQDRRNMCSMFEYLHPSWWQQQGDTKDKRQRQKVQTTDQYNNRTQWEP